MATIDADELIEMLDECDRVDADIEEVRSFIALRLARGRILQHFPSATGFHGIDSDQGPIVWITSVIDPTAPDEVRDLLDCPESLQDDLAKVSNHLVDTDGFTPASWQRVAERSEPGWMFNFTRFR